MVKFTEDAERSILTAALAYRLALDAYEPDTWPSVEAVQEAWERKEAAQRELLREIKGAGIEP